MILASLSLIFAIAAFGLQLESAKKPGQYGSKRSAKNILLLIIITAASFAVFEAHNAYRQFASWKADPLAQYFLPPHRSMGYFADYAASRFFLPLCTSIAAAFLLIFLTKALNRKFDERFLEAEEPYLLGLGVVLSGYPGFIFYAATVLFLGLMLAIASAFMKKGRVSLYFLWLPAAILAILITKFLIPEALVARFYF